MSGFAELCVTTNFSFLRSGSHPEEFVERAAELGLAGIGIADRNTLAGVVRAHTKAKTVKEKCGVDLRVIVGARLAFRDGTPDLIVYPKNRVAYARLTRLLSDGNRRAPKGKCYLDLADYLKYARSLQTIIVPSFDLGGKPEGLEDLIEKITTASGAIWLAAPFQFDGEDRRRIKQLNRVAVRTGARLLATTDPVLHRIERRPLLDVVSCIRQKKTLKDASDFLAPNAERCLKSAAEMMRLYKDAPASVDEAVTFMSDITFSMEELRYNYPEETSEGYPSSQDALRSRTWVGAHQRYPQGIPSKVQDSLVRELGIVERKQYAPYFLTVADIVDFARSPYDKDGRPKVPIYCQGRGSAANSAICYCLGITAVDPSERTLLFDRFVSEERNEPPDIDVDFEHERREEVIQYVYHKYGRDRAGLAATLICYRGRSAVREVAKAFGYSEDRISSLSKTLHWWSQGVSKKDLVELGLDVADTKLMKCIELANQLQGFPRHLSQHVGGFIITRSKLHDVVPIQNAAMDDRTVVEWNKDDLEDLGILKVDLLGLGMLTCLRKALDLAKEHYPVQKLVKLDSKDTNDPRVYAMLHRADSIGVFQVESRAQMSMLPRLKPKEFYDLVIEVAIVRPGPIQGGMVHPYLKRRKDEELGKPLDHPYPKLAKVLERTLGVPLFQEQAMQIAIEGAGFSPPEADKLRRAMATFKRVGTINQLKDKYINGMVRNNFDRAFAEASFRQIEGFGEYGFPESHAASFAILVYASSWFKCYYPDVFAAALLNAQPMGFYAPAQIVRDAIDHGVDVLPIDVNRSDWDNTLELNLAPRAQLHSRHAEMAQDIKSTHAIRLGFRQAQGLSEAAMKTFVAARGNGYDSVRNVWLKSGLDHSAIEKLAELDAFRSLGLDRRDALWASRALNRVAGQEDLPLFQQSDEPSKEPDYGLPPMLLGEHIVEDYRTIGLSLRQHPVALLRDELTERRAVKAEMLTKMRNGERTRVAGLVLVRQRPGTASGVIFMTLEDETGIANIIVWPRMFEEYRAQILGGRLVAIDGVVQTESGVTHVIAERAHDCTSMLSRLSAHGANLDPTGPTDEPRRSGQHEDPRQRHSRDVRINLNVSPAAKVMPKGRNFH